MWPPPDALIAAWEKLVGDRTTSAEFAESVLQPLIDTLASQHRDAHPHVVATAAEDTVLELLKNPSRFDPAQRGLRGYLLMAAEGDLANIRAKERRHIRNRNPCDVVELDPAARNEEVDDDSPSFDSPELRAIIDGFSPEERRVLDLQRGGERKTAAFAEVLGIADRPAPEQEAEVKRVKDRILKRFQRAAGGRRD